MNCKVSIHRAVCRKWHNFVAVIVHCNGPGVDVLFVSVDDSNAVMVRLFGIISNVEEDKIGEMLQVINECNGQYRYAKFFLDSESDINIEYDFPARTDDSHIGPMACEIFVRIMRIVDECYPKLMKDRE